MVLTTDTRRRYRKQRRAELIEYKGAECERCGMGYPAEVFDFHHRNPNNKLFTLKVSTMTDRNWEDIITEADKCALLCANCHRQVHANEEEAYFEYDTDSGHRDRRSEGDQMSLFSHSGLEEPE